MGVLTGKYHAAEAVPEDAQVVRLTSDGTISIGAHTVTHPSLPALPDDVKRLEVSASLQTCAQIAGAKIGGFAYPYGDRDDATKSIVKECGARWACSTREAAVNTARVDPFDLPRIQVKDWSGAQLARVLLNQWIEE
jgi:peptidoglycan/xylan/chitin deacetylase (PgdA/CDA1 family)